MDLIAEALSIQLKDYDEFSIQIRNDFKQETYLFNKIARGSWQTSNQKLVTLLFEIKYKFLKNESTYAELIEDKFINFQFVVDLSVFKDLSLDILELIKKKVTLSPTIGRVIMIMFEL